MKKLTITIISMLFAVQTFSQKEEWIREFWSTKITSMRDLITTYDDGYILLATINWDYKTRYMWPIKLDVNGEILWERKIGNGEDITNFMSIHQDSDGSLLLAGGTTWLDPYKGDPMFMKLNACGEKEWCRIFHETVPYKSFPAGLNIFPLAQGDGYLGLVMQWGGGFVPPQFKGTWLFRMNNNGNLLWIKNVFDEVHTEAWNEIPQSMFKSNFLTDDGKEQFIITTWTIYNDFGLNEGFGKNMVCAVDADGEELWWAIHQQDEQYWCDWWANSAEDKYGNIYTVGRSGNYPGLAYHPTLYKTGKNGEKLFHKFIIDSTDYAGAFCVNIMNDTIIDIGGGWAYPSTPAYAAIARADTNGNLIMEKKVLVNESGGFGSSTKAIDNKQLYLTWVAFGPSYFKTLLFKFNYDLEYDTLYTQPFDYDYLCDNLPIASDTIGIDDCDIWTGFPGEIEYRAAKYLLIFPNPADSRITVRLPEYTAEERKWGTMTSRHYNLQYHKYAVLRVFDLFGRQVMEHSLRNKEGNSVDLDISTLTSGIYLVNLFEKDKLMSSGKFVKK
jgi:hypothetical protein